MVCILNIVNIVDIWGMTPSNQFCKNFFPGLLSEILESKGNFGIMYKQIRHPSQLTPLLHSPLTVQLLWSLLNLSSVLQAGSNLALCRWGTTLSPSSHPDTQGGGSRTFACQISCSLYNLPSFIHFLVLFRCLKKICQHL